jgi:glycosyltransferase involved in cell wall biosynthesis
MDSDIEGRPLISVIMPVYNAEKHLPESITSILNQSVTNFEFLIFNDGSTDNSLKIIKSFNDTRIRVFHSEINQGYLVHLNHGLEIASGNYIARMDADDISLTDRFKKQLTYFDQHPEVDICGSWVEVFGTSPYIFKYPLFHDDIKVSLLFALGLGHPVVMAKKSFFDNNHYDQDYYPAEDYALWVSAIDSHIFANIPEVLLQYRLHENQISIVRNEVQSNDTNRLVRTMLNRVGCDFTQEEEILFFSLANLEPVDINEAEQVLVKIIESNNHSNYFNQKALRSYVGRKYWEIANGSTLNGKKTLQYFFKSPLLNYIKVSPFSYLKFIFRCVKKF